MKTLFIRFLDAGDADAALTPLAEAGLTLDVIGEIYAEEAPIPGWHVNVLAAELPEALRPFEIFPVTPVRVFAVESEPLRVPQEVTMGQARLALFDQHGIETDEQFFAMVDMLPEADRARARLELRTRPTVRRENPLVQLLGQDMAWDLDALFVYAGGL
jgi:hypothetical protein